MKPLEGTQALAFSRSACGGRVRRHCEPFPEQAFQNTMAPAHGAFVSTLGFREMYPAVQDRVEWPVTPARKCSGRSNPARPLKSLTPAMNASVKGERINRDLGRQMVTTAAGQYPVAIVLSCTVSRAPSELLSTPFKVLAEKFWHSGWLLREYCRTALMSSEPPQRTERLVLLLTQHQEPLFRYIFSLAACEADAWDILQETSLAHYRKFDAYDASLPFLPWADRFAYLQVQKHREKTVRSPLLFSEDVLDLLAQDRQCMKPELNQRLRFLDGCLDTLTARDKELVSSRYAMRQGAVEMMQRFAMSRRTLFRNLELLRQRLHDCVTRQLQSEGLS